MGARAVRVLIAVGTLLMLAAGLAFAWLIAQALTNRAVLVMLNSDLHRVSGRTGPHNTSTLITIIALSVIGFLVGVVCVTIGAANRPGKPRTELTAVQEA
ncbi:hypothetical protein F1C58_16190 (plasmid) [Glaciihabitans sp. INWT7]|uniref:hypothetical protein n=1 Tax=Glaciihabitans sp. INWT7 TaxID=2596912 RepID=UPI0016295643|nr:hypothetical protein [Glaciihabitans sp. INWT7]QNE48599.1 hypothetical protein F1C58_16190 [Glaciihabitans sp. INWT7]